MNMKKQILIFLLLLVTWMCLLTACGDEGAPIDTTAPDTTVTTEALSNDIVIMEEGAFKYRVVRPDMTDDATIKAAITLCSLIERETGVLPEITTDWIKKGTEPDPNTLDILVGFTNYPESMQVLEGKRYGDYVVTPIGNKIVVNAWSSSSLPAAVTAFYEALTVDRAAGTATLPADTYCTGTTNKSVSFIPVYQVSR